MKKLIVLIAFLLIGCATARTGSIDTPTQQYDPNGALTTGHIGAGGYDAGQFIPQDGFIKLNYPERDDYNPKATTRQCSKWVKRCEWWCADDMGF